VSPSTQTIGTLDPSFHAQSTDVARGNTTVTAGTPSGFSTPAGGLNMVLVTVNNQTVVHPPAISVGKNLKGVTDNVTLTGSAPSGDCVINGVHRNGLCVVVTSNDPSRLLLSTAPDVAGSASITLFIPAGLTHTAVGLFS